MIEFCKRSKGKTSTILVYKMTRFSLGKTSLEIPILQ